MTKKNCRAFNLKKKLCFLFIIRCAGHEGSAACLNFNMMLILLPVCRKLISLIRGSCKCCPRRLRKQLDKNITYHKYIAYMICLHSAIHIGAHYFNFQRLADAQTSKKDDIRNFLSRLPYTQNGSWINPIRTSNPDLTKELMKTVAGVTGVVITLCLIVMVSSSTETIRRLIHHQTNLDTHPIADCSSKYRSWGSSECPVPEFEGSLPKAHHLAGFISGLRRVAITKVVTHQSRVFEIQMQKKGFKAAPGQYILIQCPSISRLEWHPFTLTSAPNDDYFSVHIRRVGDWTNALADLCHVDKEEFRDASKMPRIKVDGPFGTATEDVLAYDVAVLVGCGIGVTPFASVLKSLWYHICQPGQNLTLKCIYLYWVCPDTTAFEWFQGLLLDLERQVKQKSREELLRFHIYLTRGWDSSQARNIILHDDVSVYDAVTGLHHKTHFGRPQWENVFRELSQLHRGMSTGVFFCGPNSLSSTLHKLCNRFSNSQEKTKFYYNKENF
ncbi:hypothetical protein Btru_077371 [Bulinus truncatus]|nr:hypothetical protein Btru_077371 [Bulinus truncatus]